VAVAGGEVEGLEENCPQVWWKSPDFKRNVGALEQTGFDRYFWV